METAILKNNSEIIDTIISNSPEETIEFGRKFAKSLASGTVVALVGEMGSGKTTFVNGVCEGLKIEGSVSSPTFTLINEYYGVLPVYHFDFYRIADAADASEMGCEDYFYGDGVCLIEWPENVESIIPQKKIEVRFKNYFEQGFDTKRKIQIIRK